MEGLSDERIVALIPALAEAARANESTLDRFVAPRTGIVEEAAARRHQFVLGRRGVGKSSLLRKVQKDLGDRETGIVVFIDLETYRGVPYPDVLIQLLMELFSELDDEIAGRSKRHPIRRIRLRRSRIRLRALREDFRELLAAPQAAEHTVRRLEEKAKKWHLGTGAGFRIAPASAAIEASGGISKEDASLHNQSTEAKFTRTKMDALFSSAPLIRAVLSEAMERVPDASAYVVLDDYYHVALGDQPEVLGYLHQLVKNLPVFLKVCGVRHRLNPFVEGDPPTGVQIGQDADAIGLDLRLENFHGAQAFLESVLEGICDPLGIDVNGLITEGGRTRLVLGSGCVVRDYLNLTRMALRRANERLPDAGRVRNRITAEDVNEASAELSITKQEDLRRDSGPNADQLRKRLTSIAHFCLDRNGTNVFLVEGTALSEEEWGKEVATLADLRLVHEIGNTSIQSGEPAYRGKRFVAFTLDLSNWTGTRSEKIEQIEFWTTKGKQDLRRVYLIYRPELDSLNGGSLPRRATRTLRGEETGAGPIPLPGLERP